MENNHPERKLIRLKNFDYNHPGAYFVTICSEDRKCIFSYFTKDTDNMKNGAVGSTVGAAISSPYKLCLTSLGEIVKNAILTIHEIYPDVFVDHYIIMPNHIHMILRIAVPENGRIISAPTIGRVVGQMKRYVSKQYGSSVWQKLLYDHIIRDREDYSDIARYISENPLHWEQDKLYSEE